MIALGVEREVDHHDCIFLDDADKQNDADQGNDAELGVEQLQCNQCSYACRGQRRQDRDRMDVAFVQDAEHDVDGEERGENEPRLAVEGILKRARRALKAGANG